jgi:YD repeat-containing protein
VSSNGQNSVRAHTDNDQGLRTAATVDGLTLKTTVFNLDDQPATVTDRNGVTVTRTFDRRDRVTQRDYPDGGLETFSITSTCDNANRLVQMPDGCGLTTSTYNGAGDLLTENGPLTGSPDPDLLTRLSVRTGGRDSAEARLPTRWRPR